MMLRPAMSQILKEDESAYAFVVAVAKRAREIADQAELDGEPITEKPVKLAVDDFAAGKVHTEDYTHIDE